MFSRSVHLGSSRYVLWREALKLVKDWDQKDAFGSLGTGKSKRASIYVMLSMASILYTISKWYFKSGLETPETLKERQVCLIE